MGRTRDRRRDGRHVPNYTGAGQAITEFVLVLPVLILIFIGVLDLGRAFHTHVALGNAARVGVMYAHQVYDPALQGDCPTPVPVPNATPEPTPPCHPIQVQDVINKVLAEPQGGINTSALTVTVCLPGPRCYPYRQGVTPTYPVSLTYGEPININVTSPFTTITPFVHLSTIGGRVYGRTFPQVAQLNVAVLPAEQTAAAALWTPTPTPLPTNTPAPTNTPTVTPTPCVVPGVPTMLPVSKSGGDDVVTWTAGSPPGTTWTVTQWADKNASKRLGTPQTVSSMTATFAAPVVKGTPTTAYYTVYGNNVCGSGPATAPVSNGR